MDAADENSMKNSSGIERVSSCKFQAPATFGGRYDAHHPPPGPARRNNPLCLPANLERATPVIETLRRIAGAHDATPAHQRQTCRLVGQTLDRLARHFRNQEGIVQGASHRADERLGAIMDHAGIFAEQQHNPAVPWIAQKSLDTSRLQLQRY